MITVTISINERPIYTRSAVNTTKQDADGKTIYAVDDGTEIHHLREDGAVPLAIEMLKTIKDVGFQQPSITLKQLKDFVLSASQNQKAPDKKAPIGNLKKARTSKPAGKVCPICHGKGEYMMNQDAHRSAGVVPCHNCGHTGYV